MNRPVSPLLYAAAARSLELPNVRKMEYLYRKIISWRAFFSPSGTGAGHPPIVPVPDGPVSVPCARTSAMC